MPAQTGAQHPHPCTRDRADDIEGWVAREAADIVVSFGRWAERHRRATESDLTAAQLDAHRAQAELDAVHASRSWRVTAPLRLLRDRATGPAAPPTTTE